VRVRDVEQVDRADTLDEAFAVDLGGVDQDDVLYLRRDWIAGRLVVGLAFKADIAFAVVAFDDERASVVDEVEISDGGCAFHKAEPVAVAGPVSLAGVECDNA